LHNKHGRRKDFFQGGPTANVSSDSQKDFSRGGKVVKFRFTHSKLRKQPFLPNI